MFFSRSESSNSGGFGHFTMAGVWAEFRNWIV